jgi:hypothetical protein
MARQSAMQRAEVAVWTSACPQLALALLFVIQQGIHHELSLLTPTPVLWLMLKAPSKSG